MSSQPVAQALIHMEDLSIGQRFVTETCALDAGQIKDFARQFDPQPFHLDEAAAQDSLFGGLAASGWHTAALSMRLIVGGPMKFAGGMIGAAVELSWPQPTRPGDVLHVVSEIVDLQPSKSRPGRGMATVRSETFNQHGQVVQRMTSRMVVFSRQRI